ncbi:MAG TPA: ABC transporter substrate-binding protein [Pusillimonas sp.]|uniref:ABC transporter substrate-binding protein n=1 Tax=Pusillimonas sp. TaxID=3040095 RepID=UPI002BF31B1B|nr:ABC transporter substrate-binding protein [Pusillimonas sp.]HUH87961.1 ABC transporter substrate-binding protein [Pusillimonas sp.]
MKRLLKTVAATGILAFAASAQAAEPFKIGLILPMTGPFASTGKQIDTAARLYMQEHGDTVAGRKIQIILKDDTGLAPEVTRRLAQELVVQEKVNVLAGFGLTPLAFAAAPVATQSKTPMVVMAAATSSIVGKSPYIVRTSQTVPQIVAPLAHWAARPESKIKSVITVISDYGPGHDSEKVFVKEFTAKGGKIIDSLRVPLQNPDFAPFLQRVKDSKPDAVFIFVPSGAGTAFMKQFAERGLRQDGIQLIGTGDVLDDDLLPSMGPEALDIVTSQHYSAAHDSPENKKYVEAFRKISNNMRPNFMSMGGYDGMHAIYAALEKAGPNATGDQLVDAMKGMSWTSPRGPISIHPETRDIVQNVYIRRSQMVDGEIYNVEFETFKDVVDPGL